MANSNTPFIDKNTAMDAFTESDKWLRPYFDPIAEFERLARNKPSDRIEAHLPKVTDGTLAAVVQESPKRIIQQVPTGIFECDDYPGYAQIAGIVLTKDLIPMYNRMGDVMQKSWNMVGKSLTWGRSTSYTFLTVTNGVIHTDFVIPYIKDVITEKGKVFAPDSNVEFMRSWYQKRDIKAIINREKALKEKDKNYKSDWDLDLLAKLMDSSASPKPSELMTPAEREKGDGESGGIEVIHAFQSGKGAEWYSFSPRFEDGKVLRTKISKDPRGKKPLDHMYCNIDLSNPLGRGMVELSGGTQNLIDQQMQMFQFQSTMEMGPPIKVWGNVNKATLKLRPNTIMDMGGPKTTGNDIEPYAVGNFALNNFANNYGLLKSQILQLNNSTQSASISSEAGNPSMSKTQAGVEATQNQLGVSDNYMRKQFESWFEAQCQTSVNTHFSEMTGSVTKQLKGEDLKELRQSQAAKYIDDKGILTIPYKEINDVVFKFHVDASSSEIKEDTDNAQKLTEVLKIMQAIPNPAIQEKLPQVVKLIIDNIGAEGTDDLFPELKETDADGNPIEQQPQQPAQPAVTPEMVMQMVQQAVQEALKGQDVETKQGQLKLKERELDLKERQFETDTVMKADQQAHDQAISLNAAATPQLPAQTQATDSKKPAEPKEKPQPSPEDSPLNEDETNFMEALMHKGFDEGTIEQAIVMKRQGMPVTQIIATIGAKSHAR